MAFDTHRFVKHLTQTGFTEAQAQALAQEQVMLLNTNLATRAGLAEAGLIRIQGKANLAQIEADRKANLAQIEADRKAALAQIEANRKAALAQIEANRKAALAQAKYEFTKWMATVIILVAVAIQTTLIVGLLS